MKHLVLYSLIPSFVARLVGLHWQTGRWRGKGNKGGGWVDGGSGGGRVGPVGHAGGSFV